MASYLWTVFVCVAVNGAVTLHPESSVGRRARFVCDAARRIPVRWLCDGVFDCRDYTDEDNCGSNTCAAKHFRCDSGRCVPVTWRCDAQTDCLDGSDEIGCGQSDDVSTTPLPPTTAPSNDTMPSRETTSSSETTPSLQMTTPNQNTTTRGNHSGTGVILTGSAGRVNAVSVQSAVYDVTVADVGIPSSMLSQPTAFSVHQARRVLCWSDNGRKVIMCGRILEDLNVTDYRVLDTLSSVSILRGIAVDWRHGHVYWTDAIMGSVSVVSMDGHWTGRRTVIEMALAEPSHIVVEPSMRWMFITELNMNIYRYNYDGTGRMTIMEDESTRIEGLVLDHDNHQLYWLDSWQKIISTCDLYGGNRRQVYSLRRSSPVGLALMTGDDGQSVVYWGYKTNGALVSYNLQTREEKFILREGPDFRFITPLLRTCQPVGVNPCAGSPCSHFCFPGAESQYACSCPDDFRLTLDGNTCERATSVQVESVQRVVDKGRRIRLRCLSEGQRVQWRKNGLVLKSGQNETIHEKRRQDVITSTVRVFVTANADYECDVIKLGSRLTRRFHIRLSSGPAVNQPVLLSTDRGGIQVTNLGDSSFNQSTLPDIKESTRMSRYIDVDYRKRQVYFTKKNSILRANISVSLGVADVTHVFDDPTVDIAGMSLDWVHGYVYWTDSVHARVSLTTTDGSFTKVLVTGGEPGVIAVDPIRR